MGLLELKLDTFFGISSIETINIWSGENSIIQYGEVQI